MTLRYPIALRLAERALTLLTVLNIAYGVGIVLLLVASLLYPETLVEAMVGKPIRVVTESIDGMRLMMIVGLLAVPIAHVLFGRLGDMLGTVRAGDPFVVENARRIDDIAIALLALELLHLVIGAIAESDAFSALGIDIDWSFSFTPWLAVLLLFVLARVFDHGAHMRADLEGTV